MTSTARALTVRCAIRLSSCHSTVADALRGATAASFLGTDAAGDRRIRAVSPVLRAGEPARPAGADAAPAGFERFPHAAGFRHGVRSATETGA